MPAVRVARAVLGVALALSGCGSEQRTLTLRIELENEAARPTHLRVRWLQGDVVAVETRVPGTGDLPGAGTLLATVVIQVDDGTTGARKAVVQGLRGETVVSGASARVSPTPWPREVRLVLRAPWRDADGDEIPDEVDDDCSQPGCQRPDGGAQQSSDVRLDMAPDQSDLDVAAPADVATPDAPMPDAAPPTDLGEPMDAHVPISTLGEGLVAYWRFDDGRSSATARDHSGNGNTGKLMGLDPASDWVDGRFGTAVEIGGRGHVRIEDSASLDGVTQAITISAWVWRPMMMNGSKSVLSRQVGTSANEHYNFGLRDDRLHVFLNTRRNGVEALEVGAPPTVPVGKWVHVAFVYDGRTYRFFQEGVEVGSGSYSSPFVSDSSPVIVGGNQNNDTVEERFIGRLDEVALWKRALTAPELRALADGMQPPSR